MIKSQSLLLYTVVIVFTLSICSTWSQHVCNHQPPSYDEVNRIFLEPIHHISKRSPRSSEPLRIKVHYDQSVTKLPREKFIVINNTVLPQALDYWRRALLVKPLQVPIRLSRKCPNNTAFFPVVDGRPVQHCVQHCETVTTCGEVVVPEEHLDVCRVCSLSGRECRIEPGEAGEGVKEADFIFYVSAMQTERCKKGATVAYAAHCQQEAALDRPIAGHANLCPDSISTKPQDLETFLSTVKHEILHALGFSVSLYGYFRDENGQPRTARTKSGKPPQSKPWGDNVIRKITRPNWKVRNGVVQKEVHMIVLPKVVAEVRRHFNCSELEGAELEDQGEDGTILTHWEKRVFENEAMTGTHTQNPVYSRITLALMEDSGWYEANYSLAENLKWGKNLGCDFAMRSCKEWIDNKRQRQESIHPFCDKVKKDPLETECTDSRDAVALCNLMEYPKDLPMRYQNFETIPGVKRQKDVVRYGGSVNLADYCPYIQEFTWKSQDVVVRGSQCQYVQNNPSPEKNFALESYGPSSKCFNHNRQMWEERTCSQVKQWQHWGSGCYEYSCRDGRLHLEIANRTFTCMYTNQELKIQLFVNDWLHIGTVVCPRCRELCERSGMECREDKIKAQSILEKSYPRDFLKCSSTAITLNLTVIFFNFLLFMYS